jgi:hypothetical protein
MGAFDFQMGAIDEVTFNTPLTVTRFFEYNGDAVPFKPIAGRTEGDPLRRRRGCAVSCGWCRSWTTSRARCRST